MQETGETGGNLHPLALAFLVAMSLIMPGTGRQEGAGVTKLKFLWKRRFI
jgi:hypothetical protein